MADTILVPGTCQLSLNGLVGSHAWRVILHFQGPPSGAGIWSQTQLNAMCTAMLGGFTTAMLAQWPSTTQLQNVTAIDISTNTPQQGVSTGAAKVGTGTTGYDNASCMLVSYTIPYRYRGGHPRSYLPGLTVAASNGGDTWLASGTTPFVTGWPAAIQAVVNAALANGQPQCGQAIPVYSYTYLDDVSKHKWLKKKTGLINTYGVTAMQVRSKIANQRRRNGK